MGARAASSYRVTPVHAWAHAFSYPRRLSFTDLALVRRGRAARNSREAEE
jgi:hypothetical protein